MGPTSETCGELLRPLRAMIGLKQLAMLRAGQHTPISRASAGVLAEVFYRGECRVSELAEHRTVDASVVSRQVAQLEQAELIARRLDPDDHRVSLLRATPAGEQVVLDLERNKAEWLSRALRDWGDEDVQHLAELVQAATADIRQAALDDLGTDAHVTKKGHG